MSEVMKDSGVEWLGDIPEKWAVQRIKSILSLRDERNYLPLEKVNLISLYTDKGVVQHADLEATTGNKAATADGYKKVHKDDIVVNIILCWMGAIGRSEYDGVTSPAYDVYIPENTIDSRFYHYLFRTRGFNGECYRYGRGIMEMRWRTYSSEFRTIKVVVPPLDEQRAIADFLDEKCGDIDSIISDMEKQVNVLSSYKHSLITETVTKGLDKSVMMKDSGMEWIGEIPEKWTAKPLKYCLTICNGADYKDIEVFEGGYPVIGSGGEFARAKKYIYNKPSVLFGRKGTIDKPLYQTEPFWSTDTMFYTKIHEDVAIPKYLYYASSLIRFDYYVTSTALPSMTQKDLGSEYIPIPPLSEQQEIIDFLDEKCGTIDAILTEKKNAIETMKQYKQSLIYEYVTGKKRLGKSEVNA